MGRFKKIIKNEEGIDIREVGYYSTPEFVANFISKELLTLNPQGALVLDPAVGKEELIANFHKANKKVDSYDIIDYGITYHSNYINTNFIEHYINSTKNSNSKWEYDFYIANPPYNCHEVSYIKDNKKSLSKQFKSIGVNNMYALFLSAMINVAKEGAVIGVIISDSFLTAKAHNGLRKQIIENCSIHQLILCPTTLFHNQKADVRTCILVLQKGLQFQKKILVSNRPNSNKDLKEILDKRLFDKVAISEFIIETGSNEVQFIIGVPTSIVKLFKNPSLGEKFECITGISTGNDKKYLSKIKTQGYSVPFYKNPGTKKFSCTPDAYIIDDFMEESLKVKDFMVRNKRFMLKEGITCSSMGLPFSACYRPEGSTFGVNANVFAEPKDLFWLISYLNSSLVTYLVRGVLIRSNMVTSGYISRLPIIPLSDSERTSLESISKSVINTELNDIEAIELIDDIIFKSVKLSIEEIDMIKDFSKNISKKA